MSAAICAVAGDLLYSQGNYKAAFDRFEQAVRLQPDMPDYHFRLRTSAAWKLDLKPMVELGITRKQPVSIRVSAKAHKMPGAKRFVSQSLTERALRCTSSKLGDWL